MPRGYLLEHVAEEQTCKKMAVVVFVLVVLHRCQYAAIRQWKMSKCDLLLSGSARLFRCTHIHDVDRPRSFGSYRLDRSRWKGVFHFIHCVIIWRFTLPLSAVWSRFVHVVYRLLYLLVCCSLSCFLGVDNSTLLWYGFNLYSFITGAPTRGQTSNGRWRMSSSVTLLYAT